jgi:hypothetical protein
MKIMLMSGLVIVAISGCTTVRQRSLGGFDVSGSIVRLDGVVSDAATGVGLEATRVEAKLANQIISQTTSASDGSYVLDGLPNRTLQVDFTKVGYVARPTPTSIQAGVQSTTNVVLYQEVFGNSAERTQYVDTLARRIDAIGKSEPESRQIAAYSREWDRLERAFLNSSISKQFKADVAKALQRIKSPAMKLRKINVYVYGTPANGVGPVTYPPYRTNEPVKPNPVKPLPPVRPEKLSNPVIK